MKELYLDIDGQGGAFAIHCHRSHLTRADRMSVTGFAKYFELEEAVGMLPRVKASLEKAHAELAAIRGEVILYKRIMQTKKNSGQKPLDAEIELLQRKFTAFEEVFACWVDYFAERGIIMRDLEAGLIDFPYRSRRTGEEYFLCWRSGEDGIFYFHGTREGFAGRHPITLLPD